MDETIAIAEGVRAEVAPALTEDDVYLIDTDLDCGEEALAARGCFAVAAETGHPLSAGLVARARAHFPEWADLLDRIPVLPAAMARR